MKNPDEYDDYEFDKTVDDGHDKWCDKWLSMSLPCSCTARARGVEDEKMDAFYEQWEEETPIRRSKSQKAGDKMPKHGRSLFEIVRHISRKGKK